MIVLGFIIGIIGDNIAYCYHAQCIAVTSLLVQDNRDVVQAQAYWQLFTSIFVTDSFLDAAFNAVAVIVIDRFMDNSFNSTRYFATFFGAALLGNILTLLMGPNYASAGASGGIFGLLAGTFAFTWAQNKKVDGATLGLFLMIFITSTFIANVNWLAHVGGSLGGFIAGPLLYLALRKKMAVFQPTSQSLVLTKLIVWGLIGLMVVGSIVQFFLVLYG